MSHTSEATTSKSSVLTAEEVRRLNPRYRGRPENFKSKHDVSTVTPTSKTVSKPPQPRRSGPSSPNLAPATFVKANEDPTPAIDCSKCLRQALEQDQPLRNLVCKCIFPIVRENVTLHEEQHINVEDWEDSEDTEVMEIDYSPSRPNATNWTLSKIDQAQAFLNAKTSYQLQLEQEFDPDRNPTYNRQSSTPIPIVHHEHEGEYGNVVIYAPARYGLSTLQRRFHRHNHQIAHAKHLSHGSLGITEMLKTHSVLVNDHTQIPEHVPKILFIPTDKAEFIRRGRKHERYFQRSELYEEIATWATQQSNAIVCNVKTSYVSEWFKLTSEKIHGPAATSRKSPPGQETPSLPSQPKPKRKPSRGKRKPTVEVSRLSKTEASNSEDTQSITSSNAETTPSTEHQVDERLVLRTEKHQNSEIDAQVEIVSDQLEAFSLPEKQDEH